MELFSRPDGDGSDAEATMAEMRITGEEAQALKAILSCLVLRDRTGELGILHGADRFVSTHRTFTKTERKVMESIACKLGMTGGVPVHKG